MRSKEFDEHRPIRDLLRRLIKAPAALSILWPALLIIGGYCAWHRWGASQISKRYSGLDATLIEITEPPAHVRTSIVRDIYRDTSLEKLSLLDRKATAKIASAFAMHPWVRNVIGVRKLPGGKIDVRLEYRHPVAMVHVFKPNQFDAGSYFFPVDGDGVLLPPSEFAPAETRSYIHIEVPDVYPNGAPGTRFGETRVEAAARLAEVLSPYREQAKIRSIGVHGDPRHSDVPKLELTTLDGANHFWGSPPGTEEPGEATVEMKLRKLLAADSSAGVDLRMAGPLSGLTR